MVGCTTAIVQCTDWHTRWQWWEGQNAVNLKGGETGRTLVYHSHHNGKTRYIHCSWTGKLGIQERMFGAMVYLGSSFGLWSALVPQLNSHDRCTSAMFCHSHWCRTSQADQYRHKDAKTDHVYCFGPTHYFYIYIYRYIRTIWLSKEV